MIKSRRIRLLVTAPAAALLALTFVGCDEIAEKAAEDALEDEGISGDIDLDEGKVELEGTDFAANVGSLPKDFPTDEVKVVDGEVLFGEHVKGTDTWTATIKVGDAGGDKQAAYDDAAATLDLDEVDAPIDNGSSITGVYASASYTVTLAVNDASGVNVSYIIAPK